MFSFITKLENFFPLKTENVKPTKEGKITEFKVIVRPLQAVNKLHEQMQNMLEQMKTA